MRSLLTFLFICSVAFGVQAQKYGYISSQALLLQSPEIMNADKQLESFQKDLISSGESMVAEFQAKYNAYLEQANSGQLSQVQMQQKEATLGQAQQEIQKYEQQVQAQILQKREELYKPILDRIKSELDAYAKENGYTMVFDSSGGGLLHAAPGEDLMAAMKSRLGF